MLDGNLIRGGIGEDVFMADIVQAWHREAKLVRLTEQRNETERKYLLALPKVGNPSTTVLSTTIPPSK